MSQSRVFALLAALFTLAAAFLYSFHVISSDTQVYVIPKKNLTFSHTFVEIGDLIAAYNNRSYAAKIRGESRYRYLLEELSDRNLVSQVDYETYGLFQRDYLTYEKYLQIRAGMTYEEVTNLIGRKGEEIASSSPLRSGSAMYAWKGDHGGKLTVMFQSGKVVTKNQSDLD